MNHQAYVQNFEKFMNEIIPEVIGNGDFSNYSHEGIVDFGGEIGDNIKYHGIHGVNQRDLGCVKNNNSTTRVTLSQVIRPKIMKNLCYLEYKSSQWKYVKKTTLEKDEVKYIILVKTPKVLEGGVKAGVKDCGGCSCDDYDGVVRVEYGKGEDPDKFLENLFQTIEKSKNGELEVNKFKLTKLNFIAKLSHLINRFKDTEMHI